MVIVFYPFEYFNNEDEDVDDNSEISEMAISMRSRATDGCTDPWESFLCSEYQCIQNDNIEEVDQPITNNMANCSEWHLGPLPQFMYTVEDEDLSFLDFNVNDDKDSGIHEEPNRPSNSSARNEKPPSEIKGFINYLISAEYCPIATKAINCLTKVVNQQGLTTLQQVIDDLSLYSSYMSSYLPANTESTASNQSVIYLEMISTECLDQIIMHAECYPFCNSPFYLTFMLFSNATFYLLDMTKRIAIYTYINNEV